MDRMGSYHLRQRLQYDKKTPDFIRNMLATYEAPRKHFTTRKRKDPTAENEDDAPTIVYLNEEGQEVDTDETIDRNLLLEKSPITKSNDSITMKKPIPSSSPKEIPSVDSEGKILFKKQKLENKKKKEANPFKFSSSRSRISQSENSTTKNPNIQLPMKLSKGKHLLSFPEN